MKPTRRSALCIDLAALAAEGAPEWVQLLPAGPKVEGRDGRSWTMHSPDAVVSLSLADRDRLPLDEEHSTELKAPKGEPAPAAGWIVVLEVRDGAVWGRVEWTERGQHAVESKEYRYLSPVFRFDYESGEIHRLTSAGLTNSPNFDMQALNRQEASMELLKKIAKALGLAETSTEDQVLEALNRQRADLETARNQAENPSLDKFVPRGDYDKALNRATEAEQALADHRNQARETEITTAINQALEAGKITPATKDYHLAQCRQEGGLERFKTFVESAPVVAPGSRVPGSPPPSGGQALNAEGKAICEMFGNSAEDLDKHSPVN